MSESHPCYDAAQRVVALLSDRYATVDPILRGGKRPAVRVSLFRDQAEDAEYEADWIASVIGCDVFAIEVALFTPTQLFVNL